MMMEYSLIKKLFRTIELGVDEYMSQLDLQSVSLDDSGMYVCFVTSMGAGGFSVKSSFIHVIESKIFLSTGFPQRMRLQRRLYGMHSVYFLEFSVYFSSKLFNFQFINQL